MITRAELEKLRKEFLLTHDAVFAAEEREIFEPGDAAYRATVEAREARSVTYIAYTAARGKAKAEAAPSSSHS